MTIGAEWDVSSGKKRGLGAQGAERWDGGAEATRPASIAGIVLWFAAKGGFLCPKTRNIRKRAVSGSGNGRAPGKSEKFALRCQIEVTD